MSIKFLKSTFVLLILSISQMFAQQFNILKNPSFEDGKIGWDAIGQKITISKDSYKGLKAIEFKTGGLAQNSKLLPNIDKIDGKSKYIFSGFIKHSKDVKGTYAGLIYYDSNWNTIKEEDMQIAKSLTYKKFELIATPPLGTNYITMWMWSDGGTTQVDEIELYPKSYTPSPCKLIQNGSFDKNLDGWSLYSAQTLKIKDAHSGSGAIQLYEGGMDQSISIYDNRAGSYQFSGYYKTKSVAKGNWIGLNFYDKNGKLLLEKGIELNKTDKYKKFIVTASSLKPIASIQAWVWSEGGKDKGKIILDDLTLTNTTCLNYTAASSLPPKGLAIKDTPQFVVFGFDDNTRSDGINWAIDLFNKTNNHDGTQATASFYLNTQGLDVYMEDEPSRLLAAFKTLSLTNNEIGNHTYDHQKDFNETQIRNFTEKKWTQEIGDCEHNITSKVGVLKEKLTGFRTPYLLYNNNTFKVLKAKNYLYDCSIEEGFGEEFNGGNFHWPYQLNEGSPGHNESWNGSSENPNFVDLKPVKDMWELPVYALIVPKDSECEKYGIKKGLWERMKKEIPYLGEYKIAGFDYNLWDSAKLNKAEVLGLLKYNLDLRLKGNHAPLTFGAHTQYYTTAWEQNAPNATATQMKEAISEFLTYAKNKPEVRIKSAVEVIKWCQNPKAIKK